MNIITLYNDHLNIHINRIGAEVYRIVNVISGKEYLWDANPNIWAGYSPVLFPVVGALKDGCYFLDGKKYSLPQHGFARNNPNIELVSSSPASSAFVLRYNQETLKQYPFKFEFFITYRLEDNRLITEYTVTNNDTTEMLFSLGAHPGFRCPLVNTEKYSDYYLEFEHPETSFTYEVYPSGLIGEKSHLILDNSRRIELHYDLFSKGALVLKDLKSNSVSLCSAISGKHIEVDFKGFPFLGIWAKPNADYVCIEPWMGIADSIHTDQDFRKKEGIIQLAAGGSFSASYSITLF